jgi:NAD(P)H dehydrogenase (quinone)
MNSRNPYVITGITGKIGGALARALLAANQPVRAVVRDADKGAVWAAQGCEVALAEMHDEIALTAAFEGAEAAFVLPPPNFDPAPGFPEARAFAKATRNALVSSNISKVIYLSTVGAQATKENLLTQHTISEEIFRTLPIPVTFFRPAWFMENLSWDVAPARDNGVIQSFLQPLDKPVPMVATIDIGHMAARLLRETWTGHRVVELEGPHRVTPHEIATTFSKVLDRPVQAEVVPHETWKSLFESQGMKNPGPRIRMLDGFNEGWIDFEGASMKGSTEIETVLRRLVEGSKAKVLPQFALSSESWVGLRFPGN